MRASIHPGRPNLLMDHLQLGLRPVGSAEHVQPGFYTLVAMPLRLAGAEASPVRAVLVAATTEFPG